MRTFSQLLCLIALWSPLTAQIDWSTDTTVSAVQNHSRALALMPDGRYWAVNRSGSDLLLHYSDVCDTGTWHLADPTQTLDNGSRASIVIDPDCRTLHVVWDADESGYSEVFHQEYDTKLMTWIGSPCPISPPGVDCFADDIEVTARGTVVAAYTRTGWSVWLRERNLGCSWDTAQQINTDALGFRANLQAVGETVHSSFRTTTGGYGIRYRAFDTCADEFSSPSDLTVFAGTSNTSHIAADGCGNLYIMYSIAGQICVQYAEATNTGSTWIPTCTWCVADAPLVQGNVSYSHYSLAAGAGNEVCAVYSLASESFTYAHQQHFELGCAGPSSSIGALPVNSLVSWAGFRATQSTSNIIAIIENRNPTSPATAQRTVEFGEFSFSPGPRTTKYGTSCACPFECDVPVLDCSSLPTACSASIGLTLKNAPPWAPVALLIGSDKTNLDLGLIGSPGCHLLTNPFFLVDSVADGSGTAQFDIAGPCLLGCFILQFQYAILQPSCNPIGLRMSNGLAAVFE